MYLNQSSPLSYLEPVQSIVSYLEPVQSTVSYLEPVQSTVSYLEPVQSTVCLTFQHSLKTSVLHLALGSDALPTVLSPPPPPPHKLSNPPSLPRLHTPHELIRCSTALFAGCMLIVHNRVMYA